MTDAQPQQDRRKHHAWLYAAAVFMVLVAAGVSLLFPHTFEFNIGDLNIFLD